MVGSYLFILGALSLLNSAHCDAEKFELPDPPTTEDSFEDLYKVLNIDRSASDADIKRAYRTAAFMWHPDRLTPERAAHPHASTAFPRILTAYQTLSDPKRRSAHDAALDSFWWNVDGGSGPRPSFIKWSVTTVRPSWSDIDQETVEWAGTHAVHVEVEVNGSIAIIVLLFCTLAGLGSCWCCLGLCRRLGILGSNKCTPTAGKSSHSAAGGKPTDSNVRRRK